MPLAWTIAAALSVALAGEEAPACGREGTPWVAFSVEDAVTPAFAEAARAHLAAELASRRLALCAADDPQMAAHEATRVARVTMREQEGTTFVLEAVDEPSAKTAARTIPLASVPPEGRALALGLAAAELLDALAGRNDAAPAPPAARPAADVVVAQDAPPSAPEAAPLWLVTLAGGGAHVETSPPAWRAELAIERRLGERRFVAGTLGLWGFGDRETTNGRVALAGQTASLGAGLLAFSAGRLGLDARVEFGAFRLAARGEPVATRTGDSAAPVTAFARAALGVRLRAFESLHVVASLAPIVFFERIRILSERDTVAGLSTWGFEAKLGLGASF